MTVVERGVEKLRVGRKRRKVTRFLALAGVFNLIFFSQNAVLIAITPHADAFPTGYKSYLLNGICGDGTRFDCTAPNVPIPKEGTPTNRIPQVGP